MATVPVPHQFAVGEVVTADNINTYYSGIAFLESPPQFSIIQTTTQSLASGTNTLVTLDTIESDPYNGWSAANHYYVFQVAGWYDVMGGVAWAGNATGIRQCWTAYNNTIGTVYIKSYFTGLPNTTNNALLPIRAYRAFFAVNDTLQLWTLQNSGGALATLTLGSFLQVGFAHS